MEQPKRTGRNLGRVIAVFFLGPLVASTIAAALVVVLEYVALGWRAFECFDCYVPTFVWPVSLFIIALIVFLAFEYLTAAVIGVSGYLLFRRTGWKRRSHCFMLGAVIGCAAGGLIIMRGLDFDEGFFGPSRLGVGWVTVQNWVSASVLTFVTGLMFARLLPSRATNNDEVASKSD